MFCEKCGQDEIRLRCDEGQWVCYGCLFQKVDIFQPIFMAIPTMHFKHMRFNNGNISVNRVNMIKNRCLHPDGDGEVVMRGKGGRPTDRLAVNY